MFHLFNSKQSTVVLKREQWTLRNLNNEDDFFLYSLQMKGLSL